MIKVLIVLAPGFEEIEAVTVIDTLRRADMQVTVAGLTRDHVIGSHRISVQPDCYYRDCNQEEFDVLVLPGGQPGTNNLKKDELILDWVRTRYKRGQWLAAVCAAPTIFVEAGIAAGLRLTSYPSEKSVFKESYYLDQPVVVDGRVITSRGVGTSLPFALTIIRELLDETQAREVGNRILYPFPE